MKLISNDCSCFTSQSIWTIHIRIGDQSNDHKPFETLRIRAPRDGHFARPRPVLVPKFQERLNLKKSSSFSAVPAWTPRDELGRPTVLGQPIPSRPLDPCFRYIPILKVSNNFKFIYMQDVFNECTVVELILYETKMAIFSGPGPVR